MDLSVVFLEPSFSRAIYDQLTLLERQAKRSRDSLDEIISKRRRTARENDPQDRDSSDDNDDYGSRISGDIDSSEENTAEQPSQISWDRVGKESEDPEEDTSDGYSRSSEDQEAYDEDNLADELPFSQNTVHSMEDSDDEIDW